MGVTRARYTTISRKVVGKKVHATIPKGMECGFEFFKEI